jgi:hypothetical protein
MSNTNGSAKVIAWDKSEVKVMGRLGERTEILFLKKTTMKCSSKSK